jgi:hypothetical protein
MPTRLLNVPVYHAFEFQQILSEAEIEHQIRPRTQSLVPFELTGTDEKLAFAEVLLTDLDTYSAISFVTSRNLEGTLARAEAFGLNVVCNTVAFHILDKPYLHRLEVKGPEGALNRFFNKKEVPPLKLEVDEVMLFTASRGGSGKGTVAFLSETAVDANTYDTKI